MESGEERMVIGKVFLRAPIKEKFLDEEEEVRGNLEGGEILSQVPTDGGEASSGFPQIEGEKKKGRVTG